MSDNLDIGDPWGCLAEEHCREDEIFNSSKYVIVCDGISSGKKIYLQNKNRGGYWTQFVDNARLFNSFDAARKILVNFKYNNPRVELR